ncbi:Predicted dehydrogenase [Paenibacillus sp. 1_12]|uniref:Gfo/Idh/MocA family protein n=1 Tax=Paenibacillus sp. 1_12 TaxID=1566278 RepID=UPI0008E1AA4B|nr:Gfo/Idh/MocA family oxidoreductase [Paenibacillus sp. 1_12]SFL89314.1 Predicted dehydrogenase [Paenibacillus sp. 1_12]
MKETKYKAAIIGLGQIGLTYDFDIKRNVISSHTKAYVNHQQIDLVAASDIRPEQEVMLKRLSNKTSFYMNLSEMFEKHSIDIISICTPPTNRFQLIKQIIEEVQPKVIFCEKPIAANINEANQIMSLLEKSPLVFIPNLSRRWNSGINRLNTCIMEQRFGIIQKFHIRYTRGIYNTGAHIFDLINLFAGQIKDVHVINKVETTSDKDNDPSFTFSFTTFNNVTGFAEAFNDHQYYMFEIDIYLSKGKIEIRQSGDQIIYYHIKEHPLFTGWNSLHQMKMEQNLLEESTICNAVDNIVKMLEGSTQSKCSIQDGVYPMVIADMLNNQYKFGC